MDSLPVRMRVWRAAYGLTQQKAADRLGCSLTSWSRWERGETEPIGYWWMDLDRMIDIPPWQWIDIYDGNAPPASEVKAERSEP